MGKVIWSLFLCGFLTHPVAAADSVQKNHNLLTYNRLAQDNRRKTSSFPDGGQAFSFPLMSFFVLPGEVFSFEASSPVGTGRPTAAAGHLSVRSSGVWEWRAPATPGDYCIEIKDASNRVVRILRLFVMEPYRNQVVFNGFRVGGYEPVVLDGNPKYKVPRGLVRVTDENKETLVSPHFKLREFLCKQTGDPVRYVVLQTSLLTKLEMLRGKLTSKLGREVRLHVMSGYRTPRYNRAIGNTTKYSRHLYGDAADVFVDVDGNHFMDDLNGDGKITVEDAGIMYETADSFYRGDAAFSLVGGLGIYGPKPHVRGPFIHVDARGEHTRWNDKRATAWFARYALAKAGKDVNVE